MKIITGSTGTKHITSNNDGEFNQGLYAEKTVLQLGSCFNATLVDNNTITIGDGDLIYQGRHALIEPDTTETINISTGAIGYNRIDLIVARYKLDTATGYEKITLEVLEGTPSASTPVVPTVTTGDIRKGATISEWALYQVTINGVTVSEVKKLFTARAKCFADEMSDIEDDIDDIEDALEGKQNKLTFDSTPTINSSNPVTSGGVATALAGKSATGHTHDDRYYTESEIDTKLAGKSDTGHIHDDRYYTEQEMDTKLAGKADSSHNHSKSQITDFPTSMPASDVYSWAKASTKPAYTKSEVGLGNVDNTADANKSVYYASNAGNADTVDGTHGWGMQTLNAGGATHGAGNWEAFIQHNLDGDNYFKLAVGDRSIGTKVDLASYANTSGTSTYAHCSANSTPEHATLKNIYAGTSDMTASSTALTTGNIYAMYE